MAKRTAQGLRRGPKNSTGPRAGTKSCPKTKKR